MTEYTAGLLRPDSTRRRTAHLIVAGLSLALIAAVQWNAYINHDVAWFTWAADRMLRGAVLGRDIVEPNFPLAYLVYVPAALLGQVFGLSAGLKIWMLILSALSLAMALPRLDGPAKLPFLVALALFLAFAMPREAGQREQIAFLLVLPYCLPSPQRGWRGSVVGVMAGVGFAIKPHFLIAWILVELGRKPFRTEQLALIATGAAYAISILIFFRVFAFQMLPITRDVYGAFDRPGASSAVAYATILFAVLFLASRAYRDIAAQALGVVAAGFILSALAQQRLYPYQLLPAWGLLSLGATLLLARRQPLAMLAAATVLAGVVLQVGPAAGAWWRDEERRQATISRLVAVLDRHQSFAVLSIHPFPAFPTAIYTHANYVGLSNSQWFLPAVAQSNGANRLATKNAVRQAVVELSRNPGVVVVDTNWHRHTIRVPGWNGLEFFQSQPAFASRWANYRRQTRIGPYDIYVRN